ncbi:Glyceraldehyde-3-phosphate dehydrogenase 2 [Leucobacter aridicollis]|uniref:type I glyceraldehyde-3-phosphate dehydrogenase n=1 Tax=Leucobacter aridicollis TaxID=283878 RepID=UPI000EB4D757|nr:type I glyceraldehyde-3-phosphate dehydrogenase [Leucobacter aridicollis]MCS3427797.1 glyceraldehyde 3-phosphate dehydrogenase [Leucobacter aridicollis]RKQ94936.1 glyceraldehyde 3-phosphate dehydrogenase [Mycolicibacterium mucogenicum 261Sha1.1M5]
MTSRIAINGFGRIGRGLLRAILEQGSDLDLVAVNDLGDGDALAQLFNFDSVYGRAKDRMRFEDGYLIVGDRKIQILAEREPAKLPWGELNIDVVVESTGRFTNAKDAALHLEAGAKRVLVSAPSKGADVTIARGVNQDAYDPEKHRIISNASCTTNALAPVAQVLNDLAGIEQGFMMTAHAYTGDQSLVDGPHKDPRRARAAALNIVPSSTGAAKAIGLVLPELDGKLQGDSLRVPVPVGSIVELTAIVKRDITRDELLAAFKEAAEGRLEGVLAYSEDPLVSSDIVGDPHSSIFDSELAKVEGKLVKVSAWYDNEWGFSNRVAETLEFLTR